MSDKELDAYTAEDLSLDLINISRSIGVERGLDLAMKALFVSWSVVEHPARQDQWRALLQDPSGPFFREVLSHFLPTSVPFPLLERGDVADEALGEMLRSIAIAIESSDRQQLSPLLRDCYESLHHWSNREMHEAGERSTPLGIAELLARLAFRGGSVIDPACGVAHALFEASALDPGAQATGIEINPDVALRAWMRFRIAGKDLDIRIGDAFRVMTTLPPHDAVIMQPPWGLSSVSSAKEAPHWELLPPGAPKSILRNDFRWLLLAQHLLATNGRAAVILPHQSVLPRLAQREAHEYLLRSGALEGIIALPSGGVFSHTSIATCIWLLRPPGTHDPMRPLLMIDAETFMGDRHRGVSDLSDDGISALARIVDNWRRAQAVDVEGHVARAVDAVEINLSHGLAPQRFLAPPPPDQVVHPKPTRRLLTEMRVENLKSFADAGPASLAPLTLVYGANSSGKSTLIQALLLLKQSIDADSLVTQGQHVDVGSFVGAVHRHEKRSLSIGVTYGALSSWLPPGGTPDPSLLRAIDFRFARSGAGLGELQGLRIGFGEHLIPLLAEGPEAPDLLSLDLRAAADLFDGIATGTLLYPFDARLEKGGPAKDEERRLKSRRNNARRAVRLLRDAETDRLLLRRRGLLPTAEVVMPRVVLAGVSDREEGMVASYANRTGQLAAGVSGELRALLADLVYLGPLRSAPQRFYNRAAAERYSSDGQHVAMFLFDNSSVVDQLNAWLEELEVPYSLDVVPVRAMGSAELVGDLVALALTDRRSGVAVTPADVGFGISQVLPVVVELLARRDSIICVEQPETHLHPRLQARLADLFIESALEEGRGNQLIVETHSEHLMLRVQRRIREGTLSPDSVAVLYVDQSEAGQGVVTRLRLDTQGDFLDEWPHGFFDERLDEMFGAF